MCLKRSLHEGHWLFITLYHAELALVINLLLIVYNNGGIEQKKKIAPYRTHTLLARLDVLCRILCSLLEQ